MDPQALELSKTSARASVPYAGGLAVIFVIMGLVPCLGGCVNFLLSLAGFFAVAFVLTPKLSGFPAGQTKAMIALYIGLGVAVTVTVAFVIATLINGILFMALGSFFDTSGNVFGNAVGGVLGLLLGAIFSLFYGLIVGTLLAWLGSYVALDRAKGAEVARPF